jgi:UDP-N-acetylglucosamine acyltransferase
MQTLLHPTAIIDPGAKIGSGVSVGPYTVIESDVIIGEGCVIGPHVVIGEGTRIGNECRIFHGSAVGLIAQDLKFKGEKTCLRIGDRAIIREFCTLNRGTAARGETVIGNDCVFLAYCHVGHDCVIGDHLVASNNMALAGHVEFGNYVTVGGVCSFHQFTRIGDYAMIGASSFVTQDVVPFALTGPDPVRVVGVNKVKLERVGFASERSESIKRAFRILFRENLNVADAMVKMSLEFPDNEDVAAIINFVKGSKRGIVRMKNEPLTAL